MFLLEAVGVKPSLFDLVQGIWMLCTVLNEMTKVIKLPGAARSKVRYQPQRVFPGVTTVVFPSRF